MLKKRFTKAAVALGGALVFTLAALLGLSQNGRILRQVFFSWERGDQV